MKLGEGASENDIKTLPKYRYCQSNTTTNFPYDYKTLEEGEYIPELSLNPEDSVSPFNPIPSILILKCIFLSLLYMLY